MLSHQTKLLVADATAATAVVVVVVVVVEVGGGEGPRGGRFAVSVPLLVMLS